MVIPGNVFDKNNTSGFPFVSHRPPVGMRQGDVGDSSFANIKNDTPRAIYGRNRCSRRGETRAVIAKTDPPPHYSYNVVFSEPIGAPTKDDLPKHGTRLND